MSFQYLEWFKLEKMGIVEVAGLNKKFKDYPALKNLTFSVNSGEIFGIIGPDGAGKTTLLRILAGILSVESGTIKSCNVDVLKNPEGLRDKIGVVPQNFSLYPDLTVEENLNFFARMYGISKNKSAQKKEQLLNIMRLTPFLHRRAEHLSGGMQKKLAVISSLLHNPLLLLLDEPTTGVDPVSRRELWDFFYELLKAGTTIIISTPYMDEAERCSRLIFIHRGEILLIDEPDKMKSDYGYSILAIAGSDMNKINPALFPPEMAIIDIYPLGNTIHLITAKIAIEPVLEFLRNTKLQLFAQRIDPTFEDVFISLIRNKDEKHRSY